jgi:ATP-dependent DNA ligase
MMINLTTFKPQLVGDGNIDYFIFNNEVVALEPKIDGVRCIVEKQGDTISLFSRTGKEWTSRFPDIISHLQEAILGDAIIDGEIAVLDNGKITTSSTALRKNLDSGLKRVFFAFDILQVGGEGLMYLPLMQRKQNLMLNVQENDYFQLIPCTCADNKEDVLEFYRKCIGKFEGIVLKNLKPYFPNTRFNWLKLKPIKTLDLKVMDKGQTKDGKMFLYGLEGEGVNLNRVMSSIDAPVGSIVEVCYETASPTAETERIKFPKILRRRLDK